MKLNSDKKELYIFMTLHGYSKKQYHTSLKKEIIRGICTFSEIFSIKWKFKKIP